MICVIIPCYKVKKHILGVIKEIPPIVENIIIVDDKCPENSGQFVQENSRDLRLTFLFHNKNQGVGGAMISGYREALKNKKNTIIVKLDGDGQMDPSFIPTLISPIQKCLADYTKGRNRFYFIRSLYKMPTTRLLGNTALSFINKMVTGYWNLMDPSNGYTAIHVRCLKYIPLERIAPHYFFESDMLFRLSTINAVVKDIPMHPQYHNEVSGLSILKVLFTFPQLYALCLIKRIMYHYFLRDFNIGSISLIFGLSSFSFGLCFGLIHWYHSNLNNIATPTGTIMVSILTVILGFQSILFFLQYDISMIPKEVLSQYKGQNDESL